MTVIPETRRGHLN